MSRQTKSLLPSGPLLTVSLALLFSGIWGPNLMLTMFAVVTLLLGVNWLWRPAESMVMLLIFMLQWLQASVKLFQANILGIPIAGLAEFGGDIELATTLSLTGLIFLAGGMRMGAGEPNASVIEASRVTALSVSARRWFRIYILVLGIALAAGIAARSVSGLAQPLLALASMKWAFFFMLTYATFLSSTHDRKPWLISLGLELLMGIGGYFSDFKTVLLISILGVAAAGVRFTRTRALILVALAAITIFMAVLWTSVKTEYRHFVSEGEQAQIVTVDYSGRIEKLWELIAGLNSNMFRLAVDNTINRLSYVDFFASSLTYVPSATPHTNGGLWFDAVIRPFMPRILFPQKAVLDDSARTNQYSGVQVAGAEQGASISIGYIGESYIDFGAWLMMLPLLGYGWCLGWLYRWLAYRSAARGLLGMAIATAVLFPAIFLESSITKVIGGLVVMALMAWLLIRFHATRYLRWMLVTSVPSTPVGKRLET